MEQWNPCDTQPFGDYHERNKAGTEAQRNMGNKGTWGTGENGEQGNTGNMGNMGNRGTWETREPMGHTAF